MAKRNKNHSMDLGEESAILVETMEKYEPCNIVYDIKKSYVFKDAIMQFYENLIQIFVGPAISIIGVIFKVYTNLSFLGALLISFGIFYIIFPYIMLLSNLTTVKKQKIEMSLEKKGIAIKNLLTKNNSLSLLGYQDIYTIEREKRYLRIIPQDKKGVILSSVSIPINHIVEGDLELFSEKLYAFVEKANDDKSQIDKNVFNGRVILSYDLSQEQFKKIYIKEYFRKKIHLFYIMAFSAMAITAFFVNITLAIASTVLAIFYIVYPRIGYKLHAKDHVGNVTVKNCMNGYITFEGHNIRLKTKPEKIQVAYDGEYIKYYIPVKKKYFRYIYKDTCDKNQLQRFMGMINKN